MEYEEWIEEVDRILESVSGLTHADLEDYTWQDEFEAGTSPIEAVTSFILQHDDAEQLSEIFKDLIDSIGE